MTHPTADTSPRDCGEKESPWRAASCSFSFWDTRIRRVFWVLGTVCGAVLTYTTRHYVNGDAIAYFDMAEAFRLGVWPDLVNLTYAPGYSILLGLARSVLPDVHELYVAKGVNFFCFLAAMAACDLFVTCFKTVLSRDSYKFACKGRILGPSPALSPGGRGSGGTSPLPPGEGQGEGSRFSSENASRVGALPLPGPVFAAICYSAFLLAALVWVKIQVVAPDLVVFSFVLLCCVTLLQIRFAGERFFHFGSLGLLSGLGYIFKTFFFPFSAVFFLLAALCCGSMRRAVPRLVFGAAVMLIATAPLVMSQSVKAGRLSFGESGNYNYAQFVAGRGERIHQPKVIHEKPDVLWYEQGKITSYPRGNDPAYWGLGIRPVLDVPAQIAAFWKNFNHLLGRIFMPTAAVLLWFCSQSWGNGLSRNRFVPPSPAVILLAVSLAGTLMYCLVVMEIRYVGPFVFLGFVALASLPRYRFDGGRSLFRVLIEAGLLVAFVLGTVAHSMVDQTIRDSYTLHGKTSHRDLFGEAESVGGFLNSHGLKKGDTVAIVRPLHDRLSWVRRAGVRITAEVPDGTDFLKNSPAERNAALIALKASGFKAAVANDPSFGRIIGEGWIQVPGTTNYLVVVLNGKPQEPIPSDTHQGH